DAARQIAQTLQHRRLLRRRHRQPPDLPVRRGLQRGQRRGGEDRLGGQRRGGRRHVDRQRLLGQKPAAGGPHPRAGAARRRDLPRQRALDAIQRTLTRGRRPRARRSRARASVARPPARAPRRRAWRRTAAAGRGWWRRRAAVPRRARPRAAVRATRWCWRARVARRGARRRWPSPRPGRRRRPGARRGSTAAPSAPRRDPGIRPAQPRLRPRLRAGARPRARPSTSRGLGTECSFRYCSPPSVRVVPFRGRNRHSAATAAPSRMSSNTAERTPPTLILAVLSLGGVAYAMLSSSVVPALPTMQPALHTNETGVTWLLTAVSSSLGVIIVARFIQGASGGIFPLAFGIVRDEFPREKVAGSIGLLSSILGVGAGIGIVLSGVIVEHLSYHWLFWIPLVATVIAAVATWRFIPESPVRVPGRINWLAAALMTIGISTVLLAISKTTTWGWGSTKTLGLIAAGLAVSAVWIAVETRSPKPLIDMTMMRIRGVWTTNLAAFLLGAGMYASFIVFPQFAQLPKSTGFG